MSRVFVRASNTYLTVASGLTFPVTAGAWLYPTTLANQITWFLLTVSGSDSNQHIFSVTTSGQQKTETEAAGYKTATSTATMSVNTWGYAAGVVASATSRTAYMNGPTNKGTNSTSATPTTPTAASIGAFKGASTVNVMTGNMSHLCVWSAALTDDEIAALARGVHPLRIRRSSVWGYWPLGMASPDPDLSGNGRSATLVNSPTVGDPGPIEFLDTA